MRNMCGGETAIAPQEGLSWRGLGDPQSSGGDCGISLLGDIKGATLDCGRARHASQGPVLKAPLGWAGCLGPCGRGLVTPGSRKPLEGLG